MFKPRRLGQLTKNNQGVKINTILKDAEPDFKRLDYVDEGHKVGLPKAPVKEDSKKFVFEKTQKAEEKLTEPAVPFSETPEIKEQREAALEQTKDQEWTFVKLARADADLSADDGSTKSETMAAVAAPNDNDVSRTNAKETTLSDNKSTFLE